MGEKQTRSRASLITTIAGYATALVALATSVVSCQMKQAELQAKQAEIKMKEAELQEFKTKAELDRDARAAKTRQEYLAVLNTSDRLTQARVLRFIVATETDERLRNWAQSELDRLEGQITKETAVAQQTVDDLSQKLVRSPGAEDAKIELALRSSELQRLKMAKGEPPSAVPQPQPQPQPRPTNTKAECFGRCAPDARKCETKCNGNRDCVKTTCFPQEAKCREECLQGKG